VNRGSSSRFLGWLLPKNHRPSSQFCSLISLGTPTIDPIGNNFGGRSNYIHPDRLPPTPTLNARLELDRYTAPEHLDYKGVDYDSLSLDRPEAINHIPEEVQVTDPIEGRAACHLAAAEWRLLGGLEHEGIEHDVYAETQLH
jgi:N,N-dimethylformamidase